MLRLFNRSLLLLLLLATTQGMWAGDELETAPSFVAKTTTGEKFTNETTKGKVVLLQFWTTWCPYCKHEQSVVDDLYKEFKDKGLVLLAIDVGESKKKVKEYLQANPRQVPIVYMEDTNLAARYAAKSYPIYVVINREGKIADVQRGAGGERALRQLLSKAGLQSEESGSSSSE
jgi:thiol-disulfide isomerase/thioredoxin